VLLEQRIFSCLAKCTSPRCEDQSFGGSYESEQRRRSTGEELLIVHPRQRATIVNVPNAIFDVTDGDTLIVGHLMFAAYAIQVV